MDTWPGLNDVNDPCVIAIIERLQSRVVDVSNPTPRRAVCPVLSDNLNDINTLAYRPIKMAMGVKSAIHVVFDALIKVTSIYNAPKSPNSS